MDLVEIGDEVDQRRIQKSLWRREAVAKQRLTGRRLHFSWGGEHLSSSKGRFLGEEWVYG